MKMLQFRTETRIWSIFFAVELVNMNEPDYDELGLAPIEDEQEAEIAPELPYDPEFRLIPVICSACKSRLYARESQIGMLKVCPECDRKNPIKAVPEKFVLEVIIDENGAYVIRDPEVSGPPVFNVNVDYSTKNSVGHSSADPEIYGPELPAMEKFLDGLLTDSKTAAQRKTRQEKYEESLKYNRELYEESKNKPSDMQAHKRELEIGNGDQWDRYGREESKHLPSSPDEKSVTKNALAALDETLEEFEEEEEYVPQPLMGRSFFIPFIDPRNRPRFLVLLISGFIANFFGGKAGTMFWQAIAGTYPEDPSHVYGGSELVQFYIAFLIGAFLYAIWIVLLMLFSIGIMVETVRGYDKIRKWMIFDLGFGISYFLWTAFFFWISATPGTIAWHLCSFATLMPEHSIFTFNAIGRFLFFPILFLSVVETHTFYRGFPWMTFRSLYKNPLLWLQFYFWGALFSIVPFALICGIFIVNNFHNEYWLMHTVVYYFFSSVLISLIIAPCLLLYFRLLGRMGYELDLDP